jgi:hypothetical protein
MGVEGDLLFYSSATALNMSETAYALIRWDRRERGNGGILLECLRDGWKRLIRIRHLVISFAINNKKRRAYQHKYRPFRVR